MKRILFSLVAATLLLGCGSSKREGSSEDQATIYVSILPIKQLVESLVGDDFRVEVLVPAGASPETFEPTARQWVELERAELILGIGLLDFEQNLLTKLPEQVKVINLSKGVDILAGCCSHGHHHHHHHAHGVDPHIWTSPRELKTMVANIDQVIRPLHPDTIRYKTNFESLTQRLDSLDQATGEAIRQAGVRAFYIYHPAMSYYARAYGLEQVAIEQEGKEPSAKRIAQLIERGRQEKIRNIFYQSQFPASSVEIIVQDLGGQALPIDPLAEDILAEIERFTQQVIRYE